MRWDHRPGLAVHEAVVFQGAQGLREHLLADPLGAAAQLAPAQRALGQRPGRWPMPGIAGLLTSRLLALTMVAIPDSPPDLSDSKGVTVHM
jgi:hypothetical protein